MINKKKVLSVKGLKTYFFTEEYTVKAVNGLSFDLYEGQTLGIVGESGSGKSVTSMSIMQLLHPPGKVVEGQALLEDGRDILQLNEKEMRKIRGNHISMIFQNPMTSLNPVLKISRQLVETIVTHQKISKKEALEKSIEMLKLVGMPDPARRIFSYPHQFSGGMRQRVIIAMALMCNPKILIADEPTTALDVTIQAQILDLIQKLSKELNSSTILITHDLGVVANTCDMVCIMYAGCVMEYGSTDQIFHNPKHPYTQGLLKSIPKIEDDVQKRLYAIQGQPPLVVGDMSYCPFESRCEYVRDECRTSFPEAKYFDEGHYVNCFLYLD